MSIANELSSDIACAMVVVKSPDDGNATAKAHRDPRDLSRVLLEVHQTLHRLTIEARDARRRDKGIDTEQSAGGSSAVSGGH